MEKEIKLLEKEIRDFQVDILTKNLNAYICDNEILYASLPAEQWEYYWGLLGKLKWLKAEQAKVIEEKNDSAR